MADSLNRNFYDRLLSRRYSYKYNGKDLGNVEMKYLKGKVIIMVNNSHLFESQIIVPITPDDGSESGLLPGFSMFLTILSLTIGLIYSTRRD